jgi:ribose 5-phosphate isomerase RpiB
MNVIVLGAREVGIAIAQELIAAFVNAAFTNEERHLRRLNKVRTIEAYRIHHRMINKYNRSRKAA